MAITQTTCTSFKVELLTGTHDFSSDTFKIALYTGSATINADTTVYTTSNEVSATGYTAGGNTLTVSTTPTSSGTIAYVSFSNTSWSSALTARGALIYNSSKSNKAVAVLDFGADKTSTSTFTVTFPAADATSAIVRIS
jgi:hypothetical protein